MKKETNSFRNIKQLKFRKRKSSIRRMTFISYLLQNTDNLLVHSDEHFVSAVQNTSFM